MGAAPGGPTTMGATVGGPAAVAYRFDASRWTNDDKITGVAGLIVIISLFLPWFDVNLAGLSPLGVGAGTASASGTTAHGWLWIVFFIALIELLYLVAMAGIQNLPSLPLKHEQLLLIASGINLLLVLIAFLLKPGNDGLAEVKIGWDYGAFVALIAAIIAIAPSARAALAERNMTQR